MTCQHCKSAVEKALLEIPGVDAVEVDLRQGLASIKGAPNTDHAIRAIMDEGFDAKSWRLMLASSGPHVPRP